jgi:hypothetical protein
MTHHAYAVIDRDGFFRDYTRVYSAHASEAAAIKAAKRHRVSIPGQPSNQSSAMVIRARGAFRKWQKIHRTQIRAQYSVVW